MLKKFLKEVINIIAGKQAEEIVDLLDTNKHINEFVIAKKLDLTINQTRNILYKISNFGLVSSIRKKDKKKGWYTYFWKIENLKALEFLKEDLLKKIEQLESQIKSRETKRFYVCERCHIEVSEENALLYNFTCPECGSIFVLKDNIKLIKEMRKSLDRLRKDLELIETEISKEREKSDKERQKELKKEERQKKKKRAQKRKLKKILPSVVKLKEIRRNVVKLKKIRPSVAKLKKKTRQKKKTKPKKSKAKKTSRKKRR